MKLHHWLVFVRERFDPLSHLAMIGFLFFAHLVVHNSASRSSQTPLKQISVPGLGALLLATTAFFFMLRLYDELKDHEVDQRLNPTRPLPRGLLNRRDLYAGIGVGITLQLAAFSLFGWPAILGIVLAILYSLLMFKEFFIGRWLRPRLATYAVSHTFVIVFFSLGLFAAVSSRPLWDLQGAEYCFAVSNWCLFNIFEFGRKSFTSCEERDEVPSYSKTFGRAGAVMLVVSMAGASTMLIAAMRQPAAPSLFAFLLTLNVLLAIIGAGYAVFDTARGARIYRGTTTLYMVLLFAGLVVAWNL